uniref:Interferon-induced GTP-binding protein Mx n=1 Tax=Ganoderma boninense TaxID=34458 RepID=A0A5K1K690_9APHY|nr:Interferon-induced GTP-binding protein Mx [Ganoderma boninense]
MPALAIQRLSNPTDVRRVAVTQKSPNLSDKLSRLDDDSLLELFENVHTYGGLHSLSLTCNARYSIPETIWPYVRFLFLQCNFPCIKYELDYYFSPPPVEYDVVYAPLTAFLCRLPNLHTIALSNATGVVLWEAINAVVQVPRLRNLRISGFLDSYRVLPPKTEQSLRLPVHSLATVDYPSSGYQKVSPTEIKLFSVLLQQATFQQSLEALSFPRLRELSLIGRRQHSNGQQDIPYISVLANMPRLQKLALTFSQPIGLPRQQIWPPDMAAEFPCPDLEDLSVSYPHPEDDFYAHLPPTLRRLTLRCWPRHYLHLLEHDRTYLTAEYGWYSPVLSSSEMLHILRRCPSHNIQHLEVEFEEDHSGRDLFFYISEAFPQLQYVVIHRYRPVGGVDVTSVATLAQALAPLRYLRILVCNLDFEDAPDPFSTNYNADFPPFINKTLQDAAGVLARSLSPSVEIIGLLLRQDILTPYMYFRPVRDGRSEVRARHDKHVYKTYGMPLGDMNGLRRPESPT